jgi:uncharacterized membrane protein YbhN (UPF0104 family)
MREMRAGEPAELRLLQPVRREARVGAGPFRARFSAALRITIALAVSAALLALLYRVATEADATSGGAGLADILRGVQLPLVGAYLLAQIAQTMLRAWRYRILLRGCGEPLVPGLFPLALVTAARNMFVDLLPARIGELSYVALLNRRYGVRSRSAVSSLGIAVFLDFAALLAALAALILTASRGAFAPGGLPGFAPMLAGLVGFLAWVLFRGVRLAAGLVRRLPQRLRGRRLASRAFGFLAFVADDVDTVRDSGVLLRSLLLSLGLRACKYAGLYAAFLAVTGSGFGQLARAPVNEVLVALIAGEGAAAIPVPSFMSFGTYESGGLAALVAFGYPSAQALLALLALHLVSQAVDYGVGGLALIGIALSGGPAPRSARRGWAVAMLASLGAVAVAALGGALWHRQMQQRSGLAAPPPSGVAAAADPALRSRLETLLGGRRGFLVWSSNRHGTHDILRMELPGGEITRLTSDPHTETYPRVSPDGRTVAFSRSQVPWVSQRDPVPWDAWSADAAGGAERLIARNATGPFWSNDGGTVFFQRNGGEFVERRLAGGVERVLFRAGVAPVPADVQLQSPDYDEASGRLVATLRGRGGPRITALFRAGAPLQQLGGPGDCQVTWARDRRSVFFVGHGGRQQNALYRLVPGGRAELWLDLPGDLSHEYFPRQSADGRFLVFAASAGGREHEHDAGDYELFLWRIGDPGEKALRLTYHTGNDCWPDLYLFPE